MTTTAFADWLHAQMQCRRWTINRTAQLCNVSTSTVTTWLYRGIVPSERAMRAIAWAFDVSELEVFCVIRGVGPVELRAELARQEGGG